MQAKRRALSHNRSKNGVALLAYGRSKNDVASLACAGLAAACLIVFATSKANAFDVPPFKGNDTGGIIAWELAQRTDARKLAADHCASYGKLVKRLATQPYYGGYISFACVWPRAQRVVQAF